MQRIMESGRYPHFTEMIKTGVDPDALDSQDERFEFGLDCLLDGIIARLGPSLARGAAPAACAPPARGAGGPARGGGAAPGAGGAGRVAAAAAAVRAGGHGEP